MNDEEKNIAIELLIEKSNRNLQHAKFNAGTGFWDLIVNRLYYCIFHAVTALMLQDNLNTKTHKGVSQQFGKHYVLTGIFTTEDGRFYNRLQTKREQADYNNIFQLSEEEGLQLLEKTEALQNKIVDLINSRK